MSDNNDLQEYELLALSSLRARGFAVCVFTPEEMGEAPEDDVEDAMAQAGWREINFHAGEWTKIDVVSKDTGEQA
jgi:hypothetical protein